MVNALIVRTRTDAKAQELVARTVMHIPHVVFHINFQVDSVSAAGVFGLVKGLNDRGKNYPDYIILDAKLGSAEAALFENDLRMYLRKHPPQIIYAA